MTTTDQDLRAIQYLAKRLRDDTYGAGHWDDAGLTAELARFRGQSLFHTIETVTRHAADPKAQTPGALRRPYLPDSPQREAAHPVKAEEACPTHPAGRRDGCAFCAADRIGAEGPTPPRPRTPSSTEGAALARQQLHQALTVGAESNEETSA